MSFQHTTLAKGRWQKLSLVEQMGNIGSEIGRAIKWQNKNEELFWNAIERGFELLDLTIADPRWRKRLKELTRVREFLNDAILGEKEYGSVLKDFEEYFFQFAFAAQKNK